MWDLGDVVVEALGPTPGYSHRDGSYAAMTRVAEAVGVEVCACANWRVVATAWSTVTRVEGVSWSVHRLLVAVPNRATVLRAFVEDCHRAGVTPGRPRLESWLTARSSTTRRASIPLVIVIQHALGRVERLGHVDRATWEQLAQLADDFTTAVLALEVEEALAARCSPSRALTLRRWWPGGRGTPPGRNRNLTRRPRPP